MHIIYSLYRGGAERIIESHLIAADRSRFELFVCSITGGSDLVDRIAQSGARVFLLRKRRRGDITAVTKLANLIRREKIELLHLHNSPGAFWGTLAALASGRRLPIVRTEHNPFSPKNIPWPYRLLYRYLARRTSKVICVSESVRASLLAHFPDMADRHIVIRNGIRPDDFSKLPPKEVSRAYFKLAPRTRVIGTVGRLVPVKNQKLLIDALYQIKQTVPEIHLAIVGEGPLRDYLGAHAADLDVSEQVSILKETIKIEYFYGALDVFALSSDSEGIPLTVLEALAAGIPVVATEAGGTPEVITDGVNGILVPIGSAEYLAKRITEVLLDPEKGKALAAKGQERVRKDFTADRMIREVEKVYDEVLAKRP